jgi:hypothetical protein
MAIAYSSAMASIAGCMCIAGVDDYRQKAWITAKSVTPMISGRRCSETGLQIFRKFNGQKIECSTYQLSSFHGD